MVETRLKDGHYDCVCGEGDDDVVTAKYKKVFCTVSQLLLLLGRGVSLTKVVIVVRTDSREYNRSDGCRSSSNKCINSAGLVK